MNGTQGGSTQDLMIHSEIVPHVNQVETHPFCQQIQAGEIMKEYGVQIESWGPFAEGKNGLFTNETLTAVGRKYSKSVAQVVLRWLIQRGVVAIPKSVRRDRMTENFAVFDFELSQAEMQQIAAMDTGKSLFLSHRDPATVKNLSSWRID